MIESEIEEDGIVPSPTGETTNDDDDNDNSREERQGGTCCKFETELIRESYPVRAYVYFECNFTHLKSIAFPLPSYEMIPLHQSTAAIFGAP